MADRAVRCRKCHAKLGALRSDGAISLESYVRHEDGLFGVKVLICRCGKKKRWQGGLVIVRQ